MRLELGIIGTGRIAQRFVEMIDKYYPEQISVQKVYNPNFESADCFAQRNKIPMATDNPELFFEQRILPEHEEEDSYKAVYIASPHQTHYSYAKQALEAGFHVLCEKPMTLQKAQAEELVLLARGNGLILMEGIKTAYCPGFQKVLEVAESGTIGDIIDVEAAFTRIGPTDSREYRDKEFGGSFFEFGRYPMLPIFDLLAKSHLEETVEIAFHSIPSDTAMDKYTKAVIIWKDENGLEQCMATIKTGLGVKSEGELLISGTNGYIQVPSPWWLTKKIYIRFEDSKRVEEYTAEYADSGLQYEMQEFLLRIIDVASKNELDERILREKKSDGLQSIWCAEIFEKFQNYFDKIKKSMR